MRRCARYLTVCILVLTVVFSLSGLEAAAAEETVRTGTLGDNNGVQWSYDETTKTLTLTGSDSGLGESRYGINGKIYNICPDVEKITITDFVPIGSVQMLFGELKSLKTIEMQKMDTSKVTNMNRMFYGCSSLTELDLSGFNTSNVTNMGSMFYGCSNLSKLVVSNFDTTKVESFTAMFNDCSSLTGLELSSFNTSNATSFNSMFSGCSSLKELDLSKFMTEKVTDMGYTFEDCSSLTRLNISNFNTSAVTVMSRMFAGCESLTSLDVSKFNTSKVAYMSNMFWCCRSLTSLDVSSFDTSNIKSMAYLFCGCNSLEKLDLSNFNTSNVTSMNYMFSACESLTDLNVNSFDTSNVTDMERMFSYCKSLTELDLSNFNTDNVKNMKSMFSYCSGLKSLNLKKLNTANLTSMERMFEKCSSLTHLDLSSFNTSKVKNMDWMFYDCSSLVTLDLSGFDTRNVSTMYSMFEGCTGLESLNVSNFDTTNVTSMTFMFEGCRSLKSLDLSSFSTPNLIGMSSMFMDCESMTDLDISNFDTSNVTNMVWTFRECKSLRNLDVSGFDTSKVQDMRCLFGDCNSLTSLDLSGFDLSGIESDFGIYSMFLRCNKISTLCTPKSIPEGITIDLEGYYIDSAGNWVNLLTSDNCNKTLTRLAVGLEGPKEVGVGDSVQLRIKIGDALQDPSLNSEFTWSTSSQNVARVSSTGVLTAYGVGTATIKASKLDGSIKGEYQVTVVEKTGITGQPTSISVNEGNDAIFKVVASGNNLTYQWQFKNTVSDWSNSTMAGATTNSLTVKATAARDGYQYRCIVKDTKGNVLTSNPAKLTVVRAINITTQPVSAKVTEGASATFKVAATGSNLTYQWQFKNATNNYWSNSTMAGATTNSMTVKATAARDGYQYRCVIKDSKGNKVTSNAVKLTIAKPIEITTQPVSARVTEGRSATFKVVANGTNLTYQWQFKNATNNYWSNSTMAGATTNSITVKATAARDGYQYRCVIKDSKGNKVTSNAASLTIGKPIEITTQPANQSVAVGTNATFKVVATGSNLTYQWQFKSPANDYWSVSTMAGATTNSLTVKGTVARNGYRYRCVIKDSKGNKVTSDGAKLTVK